MPRQVSCVREIRLWTTQSARNKDVETMMCCGRGTVLAESSSASSHAPFETANEPIHQFRMLTFHETSMHVKPERRSHMPVSDVSSLRASSTASLVRRMFVLGKGVGPMGANLIVQHPPTGEHSTAYAILGKRQWLSAPCLAEKLSAWYLLCKVS